MPTAREVPGPPLPPGRRINLERRGTTFVRDVAGPPGAPTLLLAHGWMASGGLNWFQTFDTLSQHFRVVAPDLRGHGRGLRSRRRFRLSDCADDLAALCRELDVDRVLAVGYSMGGPVTQLLWKRHPYLVEGLVQCATFDRLDIGPRERFVFVTAMSSLAGTSQLAGRLASLPYAGARVVTPKPQGGRAHNLREWAAAEMRRHDWTKIAEAGVALGNYRGRKFVHEIDVPTAVLVTAQDHGIPPHRQRQLAERIPDATIHEVGGGHVVCAQRRFARPLLDACFDVARRAGYRVGIQAVS